MDDTLLSSDLSISEENYKALEAAHNKGVKVVLCTGRPYQSTKRYAKQLTFLNELDAFASFNGAIITTVSGEELFKESIDQDIACELVDIARH